MKTESQKNIKRTQYLLKYSENETDIILKLEDWADKLNDYLDKKTEVSREEVNEAYQYLRTIQTFKNLEHIIRYAEYLEGATLELVENLPDEDILIEEAQKEKEFDTMMRSMKTSVDWVSVEEANKNNLNRLNELALQYTRGEVHEILKDRENKWSLLFGIIHAKIIRKNRGNVKKFMI